MCGDVCVCIVIQLTELYIVVRALATLTTAILVTVFLTNPGISQGGYLVRLHFLWLKLLWSFKTQGMTLFFPHLSCIYFLPHEAQTVDIAGALITLEPKCSASRLGLIKSGFKLFRWYRLRLHLNPLQCIHCKIARICISNIRAEERPGQNRQMFYHWATNEGPIWRWVREHMSSIH